MPPFPVLLHSCLLLATQFPGTDSGKIVLLRVKVEREGMVSGTMHCSSIPVREMIADFRINWTQLLEDVLSVEIFSFFISICPITF